MYKEEQARSKILVVDDVQENLEIAGRILEKNDYDVYVADSGATAIELAESVRFDLILMDIMMPEMDGFETCQILKRDLKNKDVPIIFLTAKVDTGSLLRGFEVGGVDYVKKPFDELELIARVRNHLEIKIIRDALEYKNELLRQANMEIERVAARDFLTDLFNRREMMKNLEHEMARFERNGAVFSVIISDIDFFKRVNDEYGHGAGDEVLKGVAEILRENLRKQDTAARWGGEEFLVLLPDTNLEGARTKAERLREIVEERDFSYNGEKIRITMTSGVAEYRETQSLSRLISTADEALYRGKEAGRNQVIALDGV